QQVGNVGRLCHALWRHERRLQPGQGSLQDRGLPPCAAAPRLETQGATRARNGWKPEGPLGPAGRVIPENIITRAPTAELRENQTDQDSLPPYDMLDAILERMVEREEPLASIEEAGFHTPGVA